MERVFAARLITAIAIATLPLLSGCASMDSASADTKKAPAQTSQNPARQMHYPQPSSETDK
jgi:hypothetical protein